MRCIKSFLRLCVASQQLVPLVSSATQSLDAQKKSYRRRHGDQLLRGSRADEIVSRFAAHIRRPESYSDGPSRGALEVVNTDSEGTGVVFAEDPAVGCLGAQD